MNSKVFPGRFAEALGEIRKAHILPSERAGSLEDSRKLLLLLRSEDNSIHATRLKRLTSREQQAIYGLYILTSVPEELRLIDELVIRYASWTLFNAGWTVFQLYFPHQAIQRSLAWLWRFLNSSVEKAGPKPPFFLRILPETVSLRLPAAELLTSALALLRKETSREDNPRSLNNFLITRHILREGRFAAMLFELWMLEEEDKLLIEHLALLRPTWPLLPPKDLAKLLKRVLNSTQLCDSERRILLYSIDDAIDERPFNSFIESSANKEASGERRKQFLSALGRPEREAWEAWNILDTLRNQYRAYPVKQDFMLRFHTRLRAFYKLGNSTIAWEFPGFFLVDSILEPEYSYIYPDEHYKATLSSSPSTGFDPGRPSIPFRTIDNPQDAVKKNSIFQIQYVEPMLSRASEFMAIKLGMRPPVR